MTIPNYFKNAALILALAAILLCAAPTWAKKKPGGGGGGKDGGGVSYDVVKLDDADGTYVAGTSNAANDVNEQDNVVGTVRDVATGEDVAVFWDVNGTGSQIIPLGTGAFANGLNDFNEIVGVGGGEALYWASPAAAPVALPPLEDGLPYVARRISNSGVICGYATQSVIDDVGEPIGLAFAAVVWRVTWPDGEMQIAGPVVLPTLDDQSQAYGLNENDGAGAANVVGAYLTSTFAQTAAVQWTVQSESDGSISVFPDPVLLETGDATASEINNLGVSCGDSGNVSSSLQARLWSAGSGMTLDPGGRAYARALNISDAGVVVGTGGPHSLDSDALVWPSAAEGPVLLAKFLPKRRSPFLGLWNATAVNEAGVITGEGGDGSTNFAFVAIPK